MSFDFWNPSRPSSSIPAPGELMADYRARLAHEQAQALEHRQQELAEQASALNTPAARIRIWERLHGLALPRDPTHRLLDVVAAATDLALEQVREEQRLRLAAAKGSAPATQAVTTASPVPSPV
jgi:hypothetical protein